MSAVIGIPDRAAYGDPQNLPLNKLVAYVDQLHKARRAGEHHDIRIGDKELFSWAGRHGVPSPGEKRLLFQQPLHSKEYADFEGEIPEGYGAGTVSLHERGTAVVTEATPDKIKFVVAHRKNPEYFTLIKSKGANHPWLMINSTPKSPEDVMTPGKFSKMHIKSVPPEKAQEFFNGLVEGKVDGASGLFKLKKDSVDVMSYRVGKGGKPIIHTERFFRGGSPKLDVPKEWVGKVLRGEIYGVDKGGKPVSPQKTSPLLNMSLENSIKAQEREGLGLRSALFGIAGEDPSDPERTKKLEEALKFLPADYFGRPPVAGTPEESKRLWSEISAGKHPEIDEGVVAYPQGKPPVKIKLRPEYDVEISDVFPGEGKYKGSAGGIVYGDGGRVGTGFDDRYRQWLWDNREAVKGRIAKITATKKLPSGKYFQPSFMSLHEDYPTKTAEEQGEDKQRNIPLDILKATAVHKGLDSGLTYGVRRGGLFQNYYANAAREGIHAALSGQDVMPRWRRTLGLISPSLSGLTDYEVARGLTLMLQKKMPSDTPRSTHVNHWVHNDVVQSVRDQLKDKKNLSPLTRNFVNALDKDLSSNSVIEAIKRYGGVGVDRQLNPAVGLAVQMGLGGAAHGISGAAGAGLAGLPDTTMAGMAHTPEGLKNIEDLKLGLMGLGAKHKITSPVMSRVNSFGLNILSPSSGEVYDMGRDIDKALDLHNLPSNVRQGVVKGLDDHLIAPAKQVPNRVAAGVKKIFKRGEVIFAPDYNPDQLKEMGAYREVYGPAGTPRLASLSKWPEHWYHKEDPWGWLQWYDRYSKGRRIEDDVRQIKRWVAFKARHGGKAFQENPTPRRAYALRNWGIDPVKLLNDQNKKIKLTEAMENYKNKQYSKKNDKP